jgi:CHASE2 domain-containing sensor protein
MQPTVLWLRLRQLPGFFAGLAAIFAVWMLSALSAFDTLDHAYYDLVVGLMGEPARGDHAVVLIEAESGAEHDWRGMADQLLGAGARQVIFVNSLDADTLHALAKGGASAVVVAQQPGDRRDPTRAGRPAALNAEASAGLRTGLLDLRREAPGTQRRQYASFRVGMRDIPTVEAVAARQAGIEDVPAVFGINYHRGTNLPRVSAERLEREAPLPEMFKDRSVMVGYAKAPHLASYDAPGLAAPHQLTQLELHALALDTLLQDKVVSESGPAASAFGLLLSGTALLLLFQPLRLVSASWVSLLLILGSVPLAWLSLALFDSWPPVVELSLMTALTMPLVYRAKTQAEDRRLKALLADTSAKIQSRLLPAGFAETDQHWIYVANLVDQLLQLKRTIFLERVPGDHRVREIRALRCSIGDIGEMRRDYQRAPYTLAIEQRGVIEIDIARRPFLIAPQAQERQFLAPLTFGGEVLGFWAFALADDAIGDLNRLREMADNIAQQIGQLLYQRQLWLVRQDAESQAWRRYLSDDTMVLYGELSRAIVALERRVSSFEHLFAGLSTAAIVFDLFGRVVLVNERMSRLLANAGIAPFEMTAADLVERVSGQSSEQVRELLQTLLASDAPTVLPAHLTDKGGHHFLLNVRSLRQDPESPHEAGPFRSNGLLLELVDVSEIHRLYGVKGELVSYLNHLINNSLATVLGATQLLERRPETVAEMRSLIETQCRKAAATVARAQDLLSRELQVDFGGSYPLDPRPKLQVMVDALQGPATERGIRFALDVPSTPLLVYANPGALDDILLAFAEFLLRDAADDSGIAVTLAEREGGSATLQLGNTGFGMPQELLDASLRGTDGIADPLFSRLSEALQQIESWGGYARITTALGEGFFVNISLRTFS